MYILNTLHDLIFGSLSIPKPLYLIKVIYLDKGSYCSEPFEMLVQGKSDLRAEDLVYYKGVVFSWFHFHNFGCTDHKQPIVPTFRQL